MIEIIQKVPDLNFVLNGFIQLNANFCRYTATEASAIDFHNVF